MTEEVQQTRSRRVTSVAIGRRARISCWTLGPSLIITGGVATFVSQNQAGTTALILLGGFLAFIAITKRVPLLLEVGTAKIDSSYEDDVFEAGRDSVARPDSGGDLVEAAEAPPSSELVLQFARSKEGFRGSVAARAAGISYRQLDYWARTGLVEPSIRTSRDESSRRMYSFADIVLLRVTKALLDASLSLQTIRVLVADLAKVPAEVLTSLVAIMREGGWLLLSESDSLSSQFRAIEPMVILSLRPVVLAVVSSLDEMTASFPDGPRTGD